MPLRPPSEQRHRAVHTQYRRQRWGQSEPIKSLVRRPTLLSPAKPQQQPVCAFAVLLLVYNLAQEAIDDGPEQGNNQLITIDFGGIVMGRKECAGC